MIFGGIPKKYSGFENAEILLQPIPYDGTSTWGKGADNALDAFIEATENMELYDIETDSEVYKMGIHVLPALEENKSPEDVFRASYEKTKELLKSEKFLTFLGGEHSISIGVIKAFYEKFRDITVLHLDAHADLRPEYMGTPYNHACALYDASIHTNLVQVGIRSMDVTEKKFLNPAKCYFDHEIADNKSWMKSALSQITNDVFITLDLDVFNPAIMPATGTPEPGGLDWHTMTAFLKMVFTERNVIGFDIVELAPIAGLKSPEFLVAKLYYKMLSYKFYCHGK